jgi:hypothetical protein
MVKLYTSGDYLDFEAPVYMDEVYFKKFCDFLESITHEKVEIVKKEDKEKHMGDVTEKNSKKWTAEEFILLLGPEDNSVLAQKIGRTDMSILMMRGSFVPNFMSWAKKKGYNEKSVTVAAITKYLEEKHEDPKK